MKKRLIRFAAAVVAALMMFGCAAAEERRLGDLVYVPAMQATSAAGRYRLRVEGIPLSEGEAAQALPLAGAEFGVYVVSSEGELTPWANPLYPSEPMRIRSGEEPVSFMLPDGMEFYLRQESAPQGYIYDEAQLIPVSQQEIAVVNYVPGELVVQAVDSLGAPLPGVVIVVQSEDGTEEGRPTGQDGCVTFAYDGETMLYVKEETLPEGVYAAREASVGGAAVDPAAPVQAQVKLSGRTRVVYGHPASGTVELAMLLDTVSESGEAVSLPLSGVTMEILEENLTVTTDENGRALASLLEGMYTVRFSYQGSEDVVLPLQEGGMLIESGATTFIELNAAQSRGRIVLHADAGHTASGGRLFLVREDNGTMYGPYAFDDEGFAVSELLEPGDYRVMAEEAPENTQFGGIATAGNESDETDGLALTVSGGAATAADIRLLTRERERFELLVAAVDEQGDVQHSAMTESAALELLDEYGSVTALLTAEDGYAQVEALSGTYTLRMDDKTADQLGVLAESEPFSLPADAEAVVFSAAKTRLLISSVDENGMILPGAVYSVTDSEGTNETVECGEDGEAVTGLLAAGSVYIEMISAPDDHDVCDALTTVTAEAGRAVHVQMLHESYGVARLTAGMRGLDEKGNAQVTPLSGVQVRLYKVSADGQGLNDTGLLLTSGEDGTLQASLMAGEYVAKMEEESLPQGCRSGEPLRIQVENTVMTEGSLACTSGLGGVFVDMIGPDVSDELLAQVRFELAAEDGSVHEMKAADGGFYQGALPEGTYLLRQTQIPQGYTLAQARSITVIGGEVIRASVPLEEYAVLSVSKTGLTFNDRLQTYIVPLSGCYGVFTKVDGEMKPYPSAEAQMTVWANITPAQIAQGLTAKLKLPASIEGTTYYLRELSAADGFAPDEADHEIFLTAGEERVLDCVVSSDRGFFEFHAQDAASGLHVAGGSYELLDAAGGSAVLTFELGEGVYRNEMAVPVGEYIIRQKTAAPGYALSSESDVRITVEPYLTQGGNVTSAAMTCVKIPETPSFDLIRDMYAARDQGMTILTMENGSLAAGETLLAPKMEIRLSAQDENRLTVGSVILSGAADAAGMPYAARIEYCLAAGGWQPSDARMTGVLSAPAAVSLADVEEDISAIRVSFVHAKTGEEIAAEGFAPGQIALHVRSASEDPVQVDAQAEFTGVYTYRTAYDAGVEQMERQASASVSFEAAGDGGFGAIAAGRDGKISGFAFFDEDADGMLDAGETGRYAGLGVTLLTTGGDVVESVRTDAQGSYEFSGLSGGAYMLRFDAGSSVVFSRGSRYSAHVISGIEDTRFGESAPLSIDGDHTDYVVNVGCIYASELTGSIVELGAEGELSGFARMSVELHALSAADEEPLVVLSDEEGAFSFTGLLPGRYEVRMALPEGYLSEQAQDGMIGREVTFAQGDALALDQIMIARSATVSGSVRIDDDGDGTIAEDAAVLDGVTVVLLRVEEGHTAEAARTTTDANGQYIFSGIPAGEYSVLFELDGDWTFTRYGEDSLVYGAVSQSGSTKSFSAAPGQLVAQVDAGVTIPAQLTVSVFKDTHFDGQKSNYEEWLEGVSLSLVRLENGEHAEAVTYRTNNEGTVVFTGVSPGEYVISYQMPGLWRATKQVEQQSANYPVSAVPQTRLSTGESAPFTLTMGQSGVRMYIGAMLSGSVSGTVYYDDNANASLDEAEEFCPEVKVELLNAEHAVAATALSGQDGSYSFEGLAPGRYYVRFTAEEGCGFSSTERTISRGGVVGSDEHVAQTRWISVYAGEATSTADAGVVRMGSLTGRIWEDSSADTVMDGAEKVLSGVTVNLMNGSGRNILATAVTDTNGMFTFSHIKPDVYRLRVDAPQGYVFSGALEGSALALEEQRDGRGYSASFQMLGGAHADGIGYGLLTQGSVSGRIWLDNNYDGMAAADESGIRGAEVILETAGGAEIARRQTTREGDFTFNGLMPGEYALRVMLEEGYVFTADGGDSAAVRSNETEQVISLGRLEMGGVMDGVRIGAFRPAVLGGVVWLDADDDGRRQSDDTGLSGTVVRLVMTSGTDAGAVMETTADESGAYRFEHVVPGQAKIEVQLPQGYAFARNASGTRRVSVIPMTDAQNGASAAIAVRAEDSLTDLDVGAVGVGVVSGSVWEDETYNGRRDSDETGVEQAEIALINAANGQAVRMVQTDAEGNYQLDFVRAGEYMLRIHLPGGMIFTKDGTGVIPMTDADVGMTQRFALAMGESRTGADAGAIAPAGVSGMLLIDENGDGECQQGEAGLEGAVITVMQGGTAIASGRTTADGSFAVGMLRPDDYRVRVTLPEDALFVTGSTLKLADPDAQEGETAEFSLSMGQAIDVGAAGVVRASKVTGRAWSDLDADGVMDASEPALGGVTVELLRDGQTMARTHAGSDGRYAFGLLRSGEYALRFMLPKDMLLADRTGDASGSCADVVPGNIGQSDVFFLAMGETRENMNIGGILPGSIGDTVWFDADGNGLQDYREPQLTGVEITLLRREGDGYAPAATAVSDEYGYYAFASLRPGSYAISVTLQDGDLLTMHFGEPLGEIDSDLDPETGMSGEIWLESGRTMRNIDIGFRKRAQ